MNPLKRLRKEVLKVSQSEVAKVAGVTQATVSRWESGELAPSLDELNAIRAKYGEKVDLNELRAA